jgi:hypothetical protein
MNNPTGKELIILLLNEVLTELQKEDSVDTLDECVRNLDDSVDVLEDYIITNLDKNYVKSS